MSRRRIYPHIRLEEQERLLPPSLRSLASRLNYVESKQEQLDLKKAYPIPLTALQAKDILSCYKKLRSELAGLRIELLKRKKQKLPKPHASSPVAVKPKAVKTIALSPQVNG